MRKDPSQRGGASLMRFPAWSRIVCIPENQLRRWNVSLRRLIVIAAVILLGVAVCRVGSSNADEWQPISPEEVKMTGDAAAPGAPAIILYRQVDRDDSNAHTPHEYNYVREKIFTEEGRKYADVEIPFVKGEYDIINIRARTVRPDGSSVVYDGKVYEKEIV